MMENDGKRGKLSSSTGRTYINDMPDEILMSITSHLPLKEAVRTSTIARRWRYLWQYSVSDLDFRPPPELVRFMDDYEFHPVFNPLENGRAAYVEWVNRVIQLLHCITIHRFRLQFSFNSSHAPFVDSWLQFALSKGGLKCLELDFGTPPGCRRYPFPFNDCYLFPDIYDPVQTRLHPVSGFTSLETLQLTSVSVTGQVLEYVISNSSSLRRLRVHRSHALTHLKVNGPSISLKHLELRECHHMQKLALIHAPNLLSLVYTGLEIDFVLGNIPQLVKLHVGRIYATVEQTVVPFRSCFIQLEELILLADPLPRVDRAGALKRTGSPMSFPCLKKLVFRVRVSDLESLVMALSSLIDKAPNLHDFRLELTWGKPQGEEQLRFNGEGRPPHRCLKTVEIIGFAGGTADVELAMFFLRIGISLERMVIDPHRSFEEYKLLRDFLKDNKKMARKRAEELKAKLSPQTTLVIL